MEHPVSGIEKLCKVDRAKAKIGRYMNFQTFFGIVMLLKMFVSKILAHRRLWYFKTTKILQKWLQVWFMLLHLALVWNVRTKCIGTHSAPPHIFRPSCGSANCWAEKTLHELSQCCYEIGASIQVYYYHYYILMPIRLWCLKEQLKTVPKVSFAFSKSTERKHRSNSLKAR